MEQIFDWILSGFMALIGFLLNSLWQSVKDLQKADKELAQKVSEIEVLVAGAYVKKVELDQTVHALFTKLDRIEDKLDKKVDKS
jgi:CHASE3 domain sensor protein